MQAEILEAFPQLDIQVYAIWFKMLPSDHRGAWDNTRMVDPRVQHFWDEARDIGTWYAENESFSHGSIAWDIYYLYGRDAVWEEALGPLQRSGYTVFGDRNQLLDEVMSLIPE